MRFFQKVKHVLAWLPILWRDQDWDFSYLVSIVQFKLRRMADQIEKNDLIESADEVAQEMRDAADHLDKFSEPFEAYPEPEDLPAWDPFIVEGYVTPCPPERKAYYDFVEEKEQEHWEVAWNMIRDKGRGWWD